MRIKIDFPELTAQREAIGAPLSSWKMCSPSLDARAALLSELGAGIEIDFSNVSSGPGQLLSYKGEQVLLYIKDTRSSLWTLQNEPERSRRFHVADCTALEQMRAHGRFERYVVTNRMDGLFRVDWLDPETRARGETEAALKVCKYCLNLLNWRGYANAGDRLRLEDGRSQPKGDIWSAFSITEFLMEYSTFFRNKPGRRDTTAAPNVYVSDWPSISERARREANWTCQNPKCAVNLSSWPGMLHCHHKNGVVTDNSAANLMVLCALCHAEQPGHQHMNVAAARRKIRELRIAPRVSV